MKLVIVDVIAISGIKGTFPKKRKRQARTRMVRRRMSGENAELLCAKSSVPGDEDVGTAGIRP